MHTLGLSRLLMIATLCLGWLGCAGSQSKVESSLPTEPPQDAWSWVPADSHVVGRVGLAELRKTELWPLWNELQGEQQLRSWVALDKVSRVTFGGTGQSQEDLSYVAALEGDFAIDELRILAKRDNVKSQRRGLLRVYLRPEGFWTQISDNLILMCTYDRLDALVARARSGAGVPVKESALYKSLAERVAIDSAHVTLLAEDPDGKGRALIDKQLARYGMGAFAREAVRLGVSVEIGSDYRTVAVAETADEERAEALQGEVRKSLETVAGNLFVRMLGISALLDKFRVSNVSNYVYVRGNVSELDFNTVIERVRAALSLAAGAGSLSEVQ